MIYLVSQLTTNDLFDFAYYVINLGFKKVGDNSFIKELLFPELIKPWI